MSHYEEEMVGRIREILKDKSDWIDLDLHPSTLDWWAQDLYDQLEDEFRGPA